LIDGRAGKFRKPAIQNDRRLSESASPPALVAARGDGRESLHGLPGQQPKITKRGALLDADLEFQFDADLHPDERRRVTGLSEAAITALASGRIPQDLKADEKIAARVARGFMTQHRIDDDLYHEAERAFGTIGMFDRGDGCLSNRMLDACTFRSARA